MNAVEHGGESRAREETVADERAVHELATCERNMVVGDALMKQLAATLGRTREDIGVDQLGVRGASETTIDPVLGGLPKSCTRLSLGCGVVAFLLVSSPFAGM